MSTGGSAGASTGGSAGASMGGSAGAGQTCGGGAAMSGDLTVDLSDLHQKIYDTNNTEDPGMGSALRVAKLIHDAMTIASMNAWHYWWVYPAGGDNGALWDYQTRQPSKRLWVEGNFARFVRPGFVRVGTSGTAPNGVLVSAYTNPADGTLAIVAINNNTGSVPLSLFVSGAAPCQLTPWVTSAADSIASRSAVSVSSSRVSIVLDAQSVTTLVGAP